MTKTIKKYGITQCALYKCRGPKRLKKLLRLTDDEYKDITVIAKFYDNCEREYVYLFFKNRLLMSGDAAGVCTDIITCNGGIPTLYQ